VWTCLQWFKMRYSLIIAGGSGTRLWPMSRKQQPKQLIPFINGASLLEIADQRLDGLVEIDRRYICAGSTHQDAIHQTLKALEPRRFLAEPMGRDTLNAVGLGAAVIARQDPQAVIGVFTADHIIEPIDQFQQCIARGFELVEAHPDTLVTFGITPTHAATGYGYLQLGPLIEGQDARVVDQFKEKPDPQAAQQYAKAGPDRYLWNSGMFVWRAQTLMDCIKRYKPKNYDGLVRIAEAWETDSRDSVLAEGYPTLEKISIDYAVMEPASKDDQVRVAAVPMALQWLDVGSWPAFAQTCHTDKHHNALAVGKHVAIDTRNTLLASSDSQHLIATIGCEDLLIIHTPDATLVCPADRAQDIKKLHGRVHEMFGDAFL